jgi:hypothetical protein
LIIVVKQNALTERVKISSVPACKLSGLKDIFSKNRSSSLVVPQAVCVKVPYKHVTAGKKHNKEIKSVAGFYMQKRADAGYNRAIN